MFALGLRLHHWKPAPRSRRPAAPLDVRRTVTRSPTKGDDSIINRINTTRDPFSSPDLYSGRPSHRVVLHRINVTPPKHRKPNLLPSSECPSVIQLKPCRTSKYCSPKSKTNTADWTLSGSSSNNGHNHSPLGPRTQMDDHSRKDSALGRYLTDEDAWKKFLVTGPANSNNKAQALARDSQHWDVVLETMLPPKAWRNSKFLKDNSNKLPFADGICTRES